MKKTVAILLAAVVMFCLALSASADAGGPEFYEYDGYVNKAEGVYTFNYNGESRLVPGNTVVHVYGSYVIDGITMLSCEDEEGFFYLSALDVTPCDEYPTDVIIEPLEKPQNYIVINRNGMDIYEYPSEAFRKLGNIPYGETVTVENGLQGYYDGPWGYITYNGVSGWVNLIMNGIGMNVGYLVDENSRLSGRVMVMQDGVCLYDSPEITADSEDAASHALTESIPVGTELAYRVYYDNTQITNAYVSYDGVSGWIKAEDNFYSADSVATGYNGIVKVVAPEGIPLRESSDFNSRELAIIPYGTILEQKYAAKSYYSPSLGCYVNAEDEIDDSCVAYANFCVSYGSETGWINSKALSGVFASCVAYSYKTTDRIMTAYADSNNHSEVLFTIPVGEEFINVDEQYREFSGFDSSDNDYAYVKYGSQWGWVEKELLYSYCDFISTDGGVISFFQGLIYEEPVKETATELPVPELGSAAAAGPNDGEMASDSASSASPSPVRLVIICGSVAVIVAASAAIMIIFIKKTNMSY